MPTLSQAAGGPGALMGPSGVFPGLCLCPSSRGKLGTEQGECMGGCPKQPQFHTWETWHCSHRGRGARTHTPLSPLVSLGSPVCRRARAPAGVPRLLPPHPFQQEAPGLSCHVSHIHEDVRVSVVGRGVATAQGPGWALLKISMRLPAPPGSAPARCPWRVPALRMAWPGVIAPRLGGGRLVAESELSYQI